MFITREDSSSPAKAACRAEEMDSERELDEASILLRYSSELGDLETGDGDFSGSNGENKVIEWAGSGLWRMQSTLKFY